MTIHSEYDKKIPQDWHVDAKWKDDCQGKKDYDGHIISVSTRYWPGPTINAMNAFDAVTGKWSHVPHDLTPTAHSAIVLRLKDDVYTLAEEEFKAETETQVKALVEAWVEKQYKRIVHIALKELVGGT